ncbi:hypothetical protein Q5P01_008340 [Channa striata]|uniref:Uncharacterized protein n=1 Tax=Channa striata TaxID=64152 RepID=A0AA88NA43_CHASR|nr:hypothetical protein Q5P01_008340 [Channa striata]
MLDIQVDVVLMTLHTLQCRDMIRKRRVENTCSGNGVIAGSAVDQGESTPDFSELHCDWTELRPDQSLQCCDEEDGVSKRKAPALSDVKATL